MKPSQKTCFSEMWPAKTFLFKLRPTYGFEFETPELERGSKTKQKNQKKWLLSLRRLTHGTNTVKRAKFVS